MLLGNHVYVLEPPLYRIGLEDRAGAGQRVGRIHHLRRRADGVGGSDAQLDALVYGEGAASAGGLPQAGVALAEERPRRTVQRVGLADGPLRRLLVAQPHSASVGHPAAALNGDVQTLARHSQGDGGESGGEQQRGRYP